MRLEKKERKRERVHGTGKNKKRGGFKNNLSKKWGGGFHRHRAGVAVKEKGVGNEQRQKKETLSTDKTRKSRSAG